jgi:triacylglycerol lipase
MPPRIKPLPTNLPLDVQRKLLFEPETNPTGYVAFEDALEFTFQPDRAVSRINAWWLADAAWLAYGHDFAAMTTILRERAGLDRCVEIGAGGTHGFVAANDRFAVVAFRGTQPKDWRDIFDDIRFAPVPFDVGHIHLGFGEAFARAADALAKALADVPDVPVWFTGHSLGAAIATLAAWRHRARVGGLCTIGSPFVGEEDFARQFDAVHRSRSLRFVNDHDVVTRVPPPPFAIPKGLYTHVARFRGIDQDGGIGDAPVGLVRFVRDVFGDPGVLLDMVRLSQAEAALRLPDALSDHTPLYYALHIWNDFAKNGA